MEKRIKHIEKTYNTISNHFSSTRQSGWADFNFFIPFLKKNMNVIDVGCGNGRLFDFLQSYLKQYAGCDLSGGLLQKARDKYPENNFFHCEMSMLDETEYFKKQKGKVDAIFTIAAFHHLPSHALKMKTLGHFYDLLKKDGVVCMTTWNLSQKKYIWKVIESYICLRPQWVRIPWKDNKRNIVVNRYYYNFSKKQLKKFAENAGFQVELLEYVHKGKVVKKRWNAHNIVLVLKK